MILETKSIWGVGGGGGGLHKHLNGNQVDMICELAWQGIYLLYLRWKNNMGYPDGLAGIMTTSDESLYSE